MSLRSICYIVLLPSLLPHVQGAAQSHEPEAAVWLRQAHARKDKRGMIFKTCELFLPLRSEMPLINRIVDLEDHTAHKLGLQDTDEPKKLIVVRVAVASELMTTFGWSNPDFWRQQKKVEPLKKGAVDKGKVLRKKASYQHGDYSSFESEHQSDIKRFYKYLSSCKGSYEAEKRRRRAEILWMTWPALLSIGKVLITQHQGKSVAVPARRSNTTWEKVSGIMSYYDSYQRGHAFGIWFSQELELELGGWAEKGAQAMSISALWALNSIVSEGKPCDRTTFKDAMIPSVCMLTLAPKVYHQGEKLGNSLVGTLGVLTLAIGTKMVTEAWRQ